MPAQITILLTLTAKLFDTVPLAQMKQAEKAVLEAAQDIPGEVVARFETADKLSDEDRKAIIDLAAKALAAFACDAKGENPTLSRNQVESNNPDNTQ